MINDQIEVIGISEIEVMIGELVKQTVEELLENVAATQSALLSVVDDF